MSQRRTKSDEYKAVRVYRNKIASIQNGVALTISELDKKLDQYLKDPAFSGTSVTPPNEEPSSEE